SFLLGRDFTTWRMSHLRDGPLVYGIKLPHFAGDFAESPHYLPTSPVSGSSHAVLFSQRRLSGSEAKGTIMSETNNAAGRLCNFLNKSKQGDRGTRTSTVLANILGVDLSRPTGTSDLFRR